MKPCLLLVTRTPDDDCVALQSAIHDEGYHLSITSEPNGIVQLAQQTGADTVILALDKQMSPLLCRDLRRNASTSHVNILATAGNSEERISLLTAGADDLLSTPLDWVEVAARLRILERSRSPVQSLKHVAMSGSADVLGHDLRNPLSVIASSLEMLLEIGLERRAAGRPEADIDIQLSENGLFAARQITCLIDDLVDLARIEAGEFQIDLEDLDPCAQIRLFIKKQNPLLDRKKISVAMESSPCAIPLVRADSALLERICCALLDNVIRYTIAGDTLSIAIQVDADTVTMHMTDHGRLILPEFEEAIFQSGYQLQAREAGSRSSIAMGLQFARAAARYMLGDLRANSNYTDQTTTFSLQLRRAK